MGKINDEYLDIEEKFVGWLSPRSKVKNIEACGRSEKGLRERKGNVLHGDKELGSKEVTIYSLTEGNEGEDLNEGDGSELDGNGGGERGAKGGGNGGIKNNLGYACSIKNYPLKIKILQSNAENDEENEENEGNIQLEEAENFVKGELLHENEVESINVSKEAIKTQFSPPQNKAVINFNVNNVKKVGKKTRILQKYSNLLKTKDELENENEVLSVTKEIKSESNLVAPHHSRLRQLSNYNPTSSMLFKEKIEVLSKNKVNTPLKSVKSGGYKTNKDGIASTNPEIKLNKIVKPITSTYHIKELIQLKEKHTHKPLTKYSNYLPQVNLNSSNHSTLSNSSYDNNEEITNLNNLHSLNKLSNQSNQSNLNNPYGLRNLQTNYKQRGGKIHFKKKNNKQNQKQPLI